MPHWTTNPPIRFTHSSTGCNAADHSCPCCKLSTLDARVEWEICHECGWEDDGQDDLNADDVRGGPNGSESLTDAHLRYAQYVATAGATNPRSVTNGGQGSWFEACLSRRSSRHLPERFVSSPAPETMPNTTE
ncbi:CPCC family cysteine-rich protein [Streptomyces sp. NPDC060366]|uniref:CPCC family cysteine-rich protein n=1 Tax=Streptomyces sp. NPDC060366 TaxID=3347105 RepID=UPI00365E5E4D